MKKFSYYQKYKKGEKFTEHNLSIKRPGYGCNQII